MRHYTILTPFKFNGAIRKEGVIAMDVEAAKPYLAAGVIGESAPAQEAATDVDETPSPSVAPAPALAPTHSARRVSKTVDKKRGR